MLKPIFNIIFGTGSICLVRSGIREIASLLICVIVSLPITGLEIGGGSNNFFLSGAVGSSANAVSVKGFGHEGGGASTFGGGGFTEENRVSGGVHLGLIYIWPSIVIAILCRAGLAVGMEEGGLVST